MNPCMPAPVSIVVPSRGRPLELESLLRSIDHQADEILVMLDGPDPDTKAYLESTFPHVNIFMSDVVSGPLYQRNLGARIAKHDIIFFLDDDIVLTSHRTIDQTIQLFESDNIGGVTIPFINGDDQAKTLHLASPSKDQIHYTSIFYAGMVAFKKNAFHISGGYREILFMHVEESDIAVRMMNHGFLIRLGLADPMLHARSPRRDSDRLHYLGARNHVLYAFFNVPMPYVIAHLPLTVMKTLIHSIRIGKVCVNLRGILAGIRDAASHFAEREPVARQTYRLCRALRRE